VATGFSVLTTQYYARSSDTKLVATSSPSAAVFVTIYDEMPGTQGQTIYLYTGAKLRNP
jgi:hypothetical protein